MKKPTRWLVAFALSLFFAIGIFFSIAHAEEKEKDKKKTTEKVAPQRKNGSQGKRIEQPHGVAHQQDKNHPEHRGADRRAERHDFRGKDYQHFSAHEREMWFGGSWHHEWYHGRFGWWWPVGGFWYFYETPVYPYPLIVSEVAYEGPVETPVPGAVNEQPQPVPWVQPQPQQFRYWCDNPRGYYPEVTSCPSGWRKVPVNPLPPPPPEDSEQAEPPPPPKQ